MVVVFDTNVVVEAIFWPRRFANDCFQTLNRPWISSKSIHIEPVQLTERLSRDPDDNLFVATALAADAKFIVSQDRDLLTLEKPFGIALLTPIQQVRELEL